jgi:hypothetical protein
MRAMTVGAMVLSLTAFGLAGCTPKAAPINPADMARIEAAANKAEGAANKAEAAARSAAEAAQRAEAAAMKAEAIFSKGLHK